MSLKLHNTRSKTRRNNKGKGKEGNALTGVSGSGEGLNGDTGFLNTNNGPEPWVNFENRGNQSSHVSGD